MATPAEGFTWRRIVVAARAGAVGGAWLGVVLGAATAATNGFHRFGDVLRLHAALGAVFALLHGACGLAAGIAVLPAARLRDRTGEAAFALAAAALGVTLAARWFELRLAYPARFPFVRDHGDMAALAAAFLAGATAAGAGLAWLVWRTATAARRRGITALRCAAGAAAFAGVSAAVLAARPPSPPAAARLAPDSAAAGRHAVVPAGDSAEPVACRVLLVGCDGADGAVIDALLAEDELPHLGELIRNGVRAPLRTIQDRASPALWTSLACSRRPEDTGILDFYVQQVLGAEPPVRAFPEPFGLNHGLLLRDVLGPSAVRILPVNATMVRTRPFWSILAAEGVRVGVVNWLVTWPARADGAAFLVSDRAWSGNGEALWDPPETGASIPVEPAAQVTEDALVLETAMRLCAAHEPQVLAVYFRGVDAAEHLAWDQWEPRRFRGGARREPHRGPVREAYLRFDRALGELRAAMGADATVVVASDHGHHAWFTWLGRGTPGGHTDSPDGVLVAAGPGVRPGSAAVRPSLYDVAPTVLRLVGVPAAADMEGRVLHEILANPAPLEPVVSWDTDRPEAVVATRENEAELERLRALGYIR